MEGADGFSGEDGKLRGKVLGGVLGGVLGPDDVGRGSWEGEAAMATAGVDAESADLESLSARKGTLKSASSF